jgi:predicted anti-sigma-YlaC factor YlaD
VVARELFPDAERPLVMLCSDVRTSLSAALDGEMPSLPPDVLDHHLEGCAECRAWSDEIATLHRSLRVQPAGPEPDRTDAILAALPVRRPARRPLGDDRVVGLRIATLVIALVQLAASLPLIIGGSMDGHAMDGHLERHIGISALAMAVGLLVVAWRPERARAMLPILGVLVLGLVWSCFGDIWAGRPVPGNVLAHGADVAGLAAVWLLARTNREGDRARRHRALIG